MLVAGAHTAKPQDMMAGLKAAKTLIAVLEEDKRELQNEVARAKESYTAAGLLEAKNEQLLGGTVERRVREAVNNALEDARLAAYIELLKSILWPGGTLRKSSTPRTAAEKDRSRKEASLILDSLIPDLAGSVVGRAHAKAASRKIVAVLNNERLK